MTCAYSYAAGVLRPSLSGVGSLLTARLVLSMYDESIISTRSSRDDARCAGPHDGTGTRPITLSCPLLSSPVRSLSRLNDQQTSTITSCFCNYALTPGSCRSTAAGCRIAPFGALDRFITTRPATCSD